MQKNFIVNIVTLLRATNLIMTNTLLTSKHRNTTKYNRKYNFLARKCQKLGSKTMFVSVERVYPYRASLHNHKKKCFYDRDKSMNKAVDNGDGNIYI